MKTHKKIITGLVFATFIFSLMLPLVFIKTANAATFLFSGNPFVNEFTLQNGQIKTVIRTTNTGGTQTLTFSATAAQPLVFRSDAQIFCNGGSPTPSQPAIINMPAKPWGKTVTAQLDVSYATSAGGGCTSSGTTGGKTITNLDAAGATARPATMTSTDGVVYKLVDPSQGLYGINTAQGTDCYGGSVIIVNTAGAQGTLYTDLKQGNGVAATLVSVVPGNTPQGLLKLIQGCAFAAGADTNGTTGGVNGAKFSGVSGVKTDPNTPADEPPTCESSDRLGLGWIFCKILRGIDSAVTAFYDEVQDQLCVKVDTATVDANGNTINSGTDGNIKCGNKENLFTPELHEVWSNIRIIATSMLVIIMLVAIIGQAVGGGKQ